jgi:dienelactone hydrolase
MFVGAMPASAAPPGAPTNLPALGAVDPFPQQDDINFQTLFALSESAYGAGELGEVSAAVGLVQAAIAAGGARGLPAYIPYVKQFTALGARLGAAALDERRAGRYASARAKFLRAASYYNCALFFVLGGTRPDDEAAMYARMQSNWAAAAALLDPGYQRVEVPAYIRFTDPKGGAPKIRKVRIPAYYVRGRGAGRKPTIIVNNGSDAQLIDVYAYGAAAAVERGYNALIFEGPGQGSLLFQHGLPFTPYWQDVITPLVDFLVEQPEVDRSKLAISGWSFGGLLVFRAAAYDHRLKAVVGDPGYVSNQSAFAPLTNALTKYFGAVSNANWAKLYAGAPKHGVQGQLARKFLVNKRGEIYAPEYHKRALAGEFNPDIVGLLSRIGSYDADESLLAKVRSHVLINSYQDDQFFDLTQGTKLRRGLVNAASREIFVFTAAREGAQLHCAPLAPQFRNEVVYDYLDHVLDHHGPPPGHPAPVVAPAAPRKPDRKQLANTGVNVEEAGAIGAGLIATGTALTTAARIRRHVSPAAASAQSDRARTTVRLPA